MKVNIYTWQTIRGPGTKDGGYTYILEAEVNGKPATITKSGNLVATSQQKAELQVLLEALRRITKDCEIELFTESVFLETGITEWIPKWKENGWKTAKGKEIANIEEWQEISTYSERFPIKVSAGVQHSYRSWIREETERKTKK